MSRPVRVPIQVKRSSNGPDQAAREARRPVDEPEPAVVEQGPVAPRTAPKPVPAPQRAETVRQDEQAETEVLREDVEMWRDRALRLQAEIENFRKRQRRLAQDSIEENRARLLRSFLMIADDLDRALSTDGDDNGSLREGVAVTQRSLKQILKQEGVERIEAVGERFDPMWHEAVGTVPHGEVDAERDTVVNVTQPGYRLDGRLLRPARVVVAR